MMCEGQSIKNLRNQLPDCVDLGTICPPGKAQWRFGARKGAKGVLPNLQNFFRSAAVFLPCDSSCGRSCSPVRALWRPAGFFQRPAGRQLGKVSVTILYLMFLVLSTSTMAKAETFFDRLLPLLEEIESLNVNSMMINLADNSPSGMILMPRYLTAGDRVIVGYDATGQPDYATVGETGLTVTAEDALDHVRGLPPGFYPVGSMLFQLEPAAQLSLYESDFSGQSLEAAQVLMTSYIDASITTQISGVIFPELTEIADIEFDFDQIFDVGTIQTTALGAVNAGEIVSSINIDFNPDLSVPEMNYALSQIANGVNGAVSEAESTSTYAITGVTDAIGGTEDTAFLALNIASNSSSIVGRVMTTVHARSAVVHDVVTTVIGAVNGGIVGQ